MRSRKGEMWVKYKGREIVQGRKGGRVVRVVYTCIPQFGFVFNPWCLQPVVNLFAVFVIN